MISTWKKFSIIVFCSFELDFFVGKGKKDWKNFRSCSVFNLFGFHIFPHFKFIDKEELVKVFLMKWWKDER